MLGGVGGYVEQTRDLIGCGALKPRDFVLVVVGGGAVGVKRSCPYRHVDVIARDEFEVADDDASLLVDDRAWGGVDAGWEEARAAMIHDLVGGGVEERAGSGVRLSFVFFPDGGVAVRGGVAHIAAIIHFNFFLHKEGFGGKIAHSKIIARRCLGGLGSG